MWSIKKRISHIHKYKNQKGQYSMKHATVTFKVSTQASNILALEIMFVRLSKKQRKVGWVEKHNWPQLYSRITKKETEKAKKIGVEKKKTHVLER